MRILTFCELPIDGRRGDMVRRSQMADDIGRRDGHRQGGRKEDALVRDMVALAVVSREEGEKASTRG